ncbi:MAG: peptidoglycan DD-metalloendopeptidase family protein [Planctomycetales bacterium]|nr:peptidoglycan DD-metalloendopeptidase family protein [Planctomycetales bacterium]
MLKLFVVAGLVLAWTCDSSAQPPKTTRTPLLRAVDLAIGETAEVELCDGTKATIKLVDVAETRDTLRGAVRRADVKVEVNGQAAKLTAAMYRLPLTVGGVRIDCPVTKGYQGNAHRDDIWSLEKDARLRLWPAGSPLVAPDSFVYPVHQRWFASDTQMANDPCYVDGGDKPGVRSVYYHYGLDIGGAEGMVDVVAATSGLVVSAGEAVLPGYKGTPVAPRYDVVYLLDDRGWYYRYSHLKTIDEAIKPGRLVKIGQPVGVLGKEGGSGGWSHLHFDIFALQPSGKFGVQEGYGFLWEAYARRHHPEIIAVARPHQLIWAGESATLDGSRSWSRSAVARYQWTFTDGSTADGAQTTRVYEKPGTYSEVLQITDEDGRVAYDFAVVQVIDRERPDPLPATIHAAYSPTLGIKPNTDVTFKVRTFRAAGGETWNFGDGSPPATVKSDGNAHQHAVDGYAVTTHRFAKPGHHIVRVEHVDERGIPAIAHLDVFVEP